MQNTRQPTQTVLLYLDPCTDWLIVCPPTEENKIGESNNKVEAPSAFKTRQRVLFHIMRNMSPCEEEDDRWLLTLQKLHDCTASKIGHTSKVPSAYKTRQIERVCFTWLGMWVPCEEEDRRWLLTLQKLCDCAASKFLVHSRPDRQRVCVSHDEECESHVRRKKDRWLLTLRKSRDCAASKIGHTPAKSCGKDWMRNLGLGFLTSELQQQARL